MSGPTLSALGADAPAAMLLPLLVVLPIAALAIPLLAPRWAVRTTIAVSAAGVAAALVLAVAVWTSGRAVGYDLGAWSPPLGIGLRADGATAALLLMAAAVHLAVCLFAAGTRPDTPPIPGAFWALSLCVLSGLNLAFVARDLFTLYVALELLTFAAVPLVCLDGRTAQFEAALQYLVFALFGSALYLLGAVLVYAASGTLDVGLAARALSADRAAGLVALGLMSAGLAAKAALFPLYLWLPPAHAGAPPAASALLSSLVIKGPIVLMLRLWLDLAPESAAAGVAPVLAVLGAGAILFCGLRALAQDRLKLLIAYSTAAQIGYVFLMLPMMRGGGAAWTGSEALAYTGGFLHLISHAFAKAAMFLAAGLIAAAMGHDRIAGLAGAARVVPISVTAFALGGLSLMGLPPSGGFVAKVMLLTVAVQKGVVWIAAVILLGGLLAGGYVLRVVAIALQRPDAPPLATPVPGRQEAVALALALVALVLGFVPLQPLAVLLAGHP